MALILRHLLEAGNDSKRLGDKMRRGEILIDLLIFVLLAGSHFGNLSSPAENQDVGGITYNAMLLNHDMVPYRDSFEQKLPGSFFITAVIIRLCGASVIGLNLFALLWNMLHLAVIMWGARRLWGPGPARWAGFAFVLATTAPAAEGMCPNYEFWMGLPTTTGLVLLLCTRGGSPIRLFCAGFLVVAGILIKQQAAFSAVALLIWIIALMKANPRDTLRQILSLGVGALAAILPILCFFFVKGELWTFLSMINPRTALVYAAGNQTPVSLLWKIMRQETTKVVHDMPILYYAGTAFLCHSGWRALSRRGGDFTRWFLVCWILGAAVGITAGMRFYAHYYLQIVPPLCLAVGWLAAQITPSPRSAPSQFVAALLLVSVLVWSSMDDTLHHARMGWWQLKFAALGREMPGTAEQRVATIIKTDTPEDATILVWGHAENMYFLSDRLAPTRYYKYWAFLTPPPATYGAPVLNPAATRHAEQFLREISESPPAAVVITSALNSATVDIFPAFKNRLEQGYRREAIVDHLELWLKRPFPGSGQTRRRDEQ